MLLFSLTVISCAKKSGSSSDSTSTTSYVGTWVRSSDNSIALDWKSDSFIYSCVVGTYTWAIQGSYSSSNSRVTWWDGSYNTLSASGSNILLDSATYVPGTLTSACNPFWTNSTSENTTYTYLGKSMGYWSFVFSGGGTTYNDKYLMSAISSEKYSDGTYVTAGTNSSGDLVLGSYTSGSPGIYTITDPNPSTYSDVYAFYINSTYTGIVSGCYYFYDKNTSSLGSCRTLTSGTKLYGTPSSYRIISEDDKDKIAIQKQKAMTKLMDLSSKKLTEQDINAHKRYQQLLQIHNSIDQKPLKRYLQSFRSN